MSKEERPSGVAGMLPEEINSRITLKLEKELQKQIMGWLEIHDVFAARQRMDKKSNLRPGYPDIWFVWRSSYGMPVPVAVECKVGGERQTREQMQAQARMEKDGWRYFLVRSLPELIEILLPISTNS